MQGQAGERAGIGVVAMMKPEEGRTERPVVLGWISWWRLEGVELG